MLSSLYFEMLSEDTDIVLLLWLLFWLRYYELADVYLAMACSADFLVMLLDPLFVPLPIMF